MKQEQMTLFLLKILFCSESLSSREKVNCLLLLAVGTKNAPSACRHRLLRATEDERLFLSILGFLVEFFLLVGHDRAIRLGVGYTGQNVSSLNLIVIQKRLVRLVNLTLCDFASAGRASTSATGIGQVNTLLFSGVENVLVVGNFNRSVQPFGFVY
jgi:hypothetical protein